MIILLFSALWAITATGASKADEDICKKPLETLPCNILYTVIEKEGLFSIQKETLESNCTKLLESFTCLQDHLSKCKPPSLEDLLAYSSGVKAMVVELCDSNSTLRKAYENHVSCFTSTSAALTNCVHVAEQKVRILLKSNPHLHALSISNYRCLAHIELAGCVRSIARHRCGPEAGQLMGELVERSMTPYQFRNCLFIEQLRRASTKEDYKKAHI